MSSGVETSLIAIWPSLKVRDSSTPLDMTKKQISFVALASPLGVRSEFLAGNAMAVGKRRRNLRLSACGER
jgi:hypothetical protein